MSNSSESEVEDPFEDSGDDWQEETKKKRGPTRNSMRLSTKATPNKRKTRKQSDSEADEDEDDPPPKVAKKNGADEEDGPEDDEDFDEDEEVDSEGDEFDEFDDSEDDEDFEYENSDEENEPPRKGGFDEDGIRNRGASLHRKFIPKTITCINFSHGSFVVKKNQYKKALPKSKPPIWRIDGKNLLQRYDACQTDGVWQHKCSATYTGWSENEGDRYAPITVDVKESSNRILTVEVHWDKIPATFD